MPKGTFDRTGKWLEAIRASHIKQFCIHGHDTFIVGRSSDGTCKTCRVGYGRKWAAKVGRQYFRNGDWRREGFKNADGSQFTYSDRDRIYQIQQGRCYICKKHETETKKFLEADHDHVTGIVRKLLCNSCNQLLGMYEIFKERAEKYLEEVG